MCALDAGRREESSAPCAVTNGPREDPQTTRHLGDETWEGEERRQGKREREKRKKKEKEEDDEERRRARDEEVHYSACLLP